MKSLKIIAIALGLIAVVLIGVLIFVKPAKGPTIPPALISDDGHLAISLPIAGSQISSPVAIEGTVINGGWFFEGSFPIQILDGNGTVIGKGLAQALSDWTSTGTVPFAASITFTAPSSASGTIVFSADNPSGLPANQKSFSEIVRFK